jgi:hypothetical protein
LSTLTCQPSFVNPHLSILTCQPSHFNHLSTTFQPPLNHLSTLTCQPLINPPVNHLSTLTCQNSLVSCLILWFSYSLCVSFPTLPGLNHLFFWKSHVDAPCSVIAKRLPFWSACSEAGTLNVDSITCFVPYTKHVPSPHQYNSLPIYMLHTLFRWLTLPDLSASRVSRY